MTLAMRIAIASAGLAGAIGGCSREPRRHEVTMKDFAFAPATLTVAVGDTVVWSNADLVPHTATARDSAWDSSSIAASGTWGFIGAAPATHEYYCVFHPGMKGTVVVR